MSKHKDVRCLSVSPIALQNVIGPGCNIEWGFARLATQLQVQEKVAMPLAARYVGPAQVSMGVAGLQEW